MKRIYTLLLVSMLAATTIAQSIDEDRMHRDLEVAENALGTIISSNSDDFPRWRMGDKDIEAGYVKDYGVVFMVEGKNLSHVKLYGKAKKKNKNKKKDKQAEVIEELRVSADNSEKSSIH